MSENNFALIDLKALSKPACKLIDSIRSATGILYEPTRIKKKAKAEAEAALILAEGKAEVTQLEARMESRVKAKEIRRQKNIESIAKKAMGCLPEEVSDEPVDEDWIVQFFENCQDVSNSNLQSVWGRILAGEFFQPGQYSLRTLNVVKFIQQHDAEMFVRLCSCVWEHNNRKVVVLWRGSDLLQTIDLVVSDLVHLQSIGLIEENAWTGYNTPCRQDCVISYFDKAYSIHMPDAEKELALGFYDFSSSGRELFSIVNSVPKDEYVHEVIKVWQSKYRDVVISEISGISSSS